jgi:hypothetical protein
VPATLAPQLSTLADILDPALAAPETELPVDGTRKTLRQLDEHFCQSVSAGLDYIQDHPWLSQNESDLLGRLRAADDELSEDMARRAHPKSASRLQALIRDFACRVVRRSVCVRFGKPREWELLLEYQQVAEGRKELLHEAAKQVETLLNVKDKFEICLNTTFGEPWPPIAHRALLRTAKQKVKIYNTLPTVRPHSTMHFLSIGSSAHSIPLTYDLFRSVRELRNGLLTASLPRTVVALLDATRAHLAGYVVRDEEALEDGEISLGDHQELISREMGDFVVRAKEVS